MLLAATSCDKTDQSKAAEHQHVFFKLGHRAYGDASAVIATYSWIGNGASDIQAIDRIRIQAGEAELTDDIGPKREPVAMIALP